MKLCLQIFVFSYINLFIFLKMKTAMISQLKNLLANCENARSLYKKTALTASNPQIKSLFVQLSSDKGLFVSEIKSMLNYYGEEYSVKPAYEENHHIWNHIYNCITEHHHSNILNEFLMIEDNALKEYATALNTDFEDEGCYELLAAQRSNTYKIRDELKNLHQKIA